jgi:Ssp1 endopeptidase immunity protein Rap1a
MRARWLALAAAVMVAGSAAEAERVPSGQSGPALLAACDAQDASQRAYCRGFIEGIADLVITMGRRSPVVACIPPGAAPEQIVDTAIEYLHEHPREVRSYSAAVLVQEAIRKAYRCR